MVSLAYHLSNSINFSQKALRWAAKFDNVCYLDSNGHKDNYGNINAFLAVGAQEEFVGNEKDTFKRLQQFVDDHPNTWIPGYLGYDLKNELEDLQTNHPNRADFPTAYFFVPTYTLLIGEYNVEIKGDNPQAIIQEIEAITLDPDSLDFEGELQFRMRKEEYFSAFAQAQAHLIKGDIYEMNLCQEFYAEQATLNPLEAYRRLNAISGTPFSCFLKFHDKYILSASPERFLSKQGRTLLSQPIKGTAPRGKSIAEDDSYRAQLLSNPKEISENVMIVDLVRNDLTKSAKQGTVKTTELAHVYSFKQVHQLISTITCQLDENTSVTQAISYAFPPGSMTGAPKISAMQLIDKLENSRRGVYAGALGYFSPQGNFDFSVVIRTLIYNAANKYLTFHTGGAITAQSEADKEYEECLLKGKAIFEILQGKR